MDMKTDRKVKLGSIVDRELTQAEGRDYDELQSNRAAALAYYKGELPAPDVDANGDEIEGRSKAVSRDVADMCGAISATMRDMLILDGELVIEPEGEQDEPLAQAEADICTDVLMKDNQGERVLLEAIFTALLMRNCAAKVLMEGEELRIRGVPIENVMFTSGWAGDFQELPFFAERLTYTRSDLVAMGIDKKRVADLHASSDAKTATARGRNATAETPRQGETPDQDEIDCHEAYVLADLDGDGIAERYVCLIANRNDCLRYEAIDHIPYALGTGMAMPYRLTGESVFDRIGCIQDRNTSLYRQLHNNVAAMINGKYAYRADTATEEDIFNPVAGGGIRVRDLNSIMVLPIPDVTTGIMQAIMDNRRQRTEALGGSLDMASAEAQIMNKSATAASIEKGNQELISSRIASDFATTFLEPLYRLIHMYLARYSSRSYLARVAGQAVPVDPSTWGNRRRMLLRCGLPPGVKAQQQQALTMHMQNSAQAMMAGLDGTLASEVTIYRTQMRWLKASGIKDPESLAIDPSSQQAQQVRQSKQQLAAQNQQQQAQILQLQMQLEQAKLAEDARQHDGDLRHKYFATEMEAEIAEAKISGQGVIDLEKQRMSDAAAARSQTETEFDREASR